MNYLDEVSRDGVRRILKTSVIDVTFIKADGTERVMKCTLDETFIPQVEKKEGAKTKTPNPEVCAVWDMEQQAWRSFRWDSLKKIAL